jgi:signal transduction histidine kinase
MKASVFVCLLLCIYCACYSQQNKVDSLDRLIANAISDTQKINLSVEKLKVLSNINLDSGIAFGNKIIQQAKNIDYKKGEAAARVSMGGSYCFTGNYTGAKATLDCAKQILSEINDSEVLGRLYNVYGFMNSMQNKFDASHEFYDKAIAVGKARNDNELLSTAFQNYAIAYQQQSNYGKAIELFQDALNASEKINDEKGEAYIYLNMGITYNSLDDTARTLQSYFKAISIATKLNLKNVEAYAYANLASAYEDLNKFQEQYEFAMKAAELGKQTGDKGIEASSLSRAALALAHQNKFKEAETLNKQAMTVANASNQPYNIYQAYVDMGAILKMENAYAQAIPYYEKAFKLLTDADLYDREVGNSYAELSECYDKTGDYKKALSTYKIAAKIEDSIRGRDNIKKATELTMNYEFQKKQQIAKDEQQKQNDLARERQSALLIGLILTIILAAVAFNGFRNKRKANFQLQKQKEKVESTLSELKSTQAQLTQAEKMASLGELTAGIAHEIQNPLNFVNNFSEVNTELLSEMKDEIDKGNIKDAKAIADDVIANEEKINSHGKRADAIVKNMLQHSRANSGQKELTDINKLADEYLRLSYHGIRVRDKTFNVEIKRDFDETIGKINVVPQDIGRVLLNLFNNALYAVNEKRKNGPLTAEGGIGKLPNEYMPLVIVRTKLIPPLEGKREAVELKVTDNGNGIPQNIIDKIFQPFFTTKPTGQGTGLGLSLAYDILKAHGGEIKVETKEGEGAAFVIQLPIA